MSENRPQDDIIDIEPQVISETKADAPRTPRRGLRNVGFVAGVALLAALGGGWIYRDVLANYLPNDEVHALAVRVDALEAGNKEANKRVDAVIALTDELKAKLGAAQAAAEKSAKQSADLLSQSQGNSQATADMKQALDQARSELDSLKAQLANGAVASGTGTDPALSQRLDVLEKNLAALQTPAATKPDLAGLKAAMSTLAAKAAEGSGFGAEFAVVSKAVPAADGLDVLKGDAENGVPNAQQLEASLATAMAQIPKAAAAPASDGWLDRIGNFFSNLVTIKTIGSDDWGTVGAKASALISARDLPQADALFKGMEGSPPAALATWHELLQKRIKLDEALEKTKAAVAREIAAKE